MATIIMSVTPSEEDEYSRIDIQVDGMDMSDTISTMLNYVMSTLKDAGVTREEFIEGATEGWEDMGCKDVEPSTMDTLGALKEAEVISDADSEEKTEAP